MESHTLTLTFKLIGKIWIAETDTGDAIGAGSPVQVGKAVTARLQAAQVGGEKGEVK